MLPRLIAGAASPAPATVVNRFFHAHGPHNFPALFLFRPFYQRHHTNSLDGFLRRENGTKIEPEMTSSEARHVDTTPDRNVGLAFGQS